MKWELREKANLRLYNERMATRRNASIPAYAKPPGLCLITALLLGLPLSAEPMPKGMFHGEMVSYQGDAERGELIARNSTGEQFDCTYDGKSYLEYQNRRITVAKLEPGDPLEILVDRTGRQRRTCYVRMVHVIVPEPQPVLRQLSGSFSSATVSIQPTPPRPREETVERFVRETIAGVVTSIDAGGFTLRTRDGDRTIQTNNATRYLSGGREQSATALSVNQRVFVAVSLDRNRRPVAADVTWGSILTVP